MVVSVQGLASQVGAQIMKSGGNAVDAAVATGFALAVVFPEAGNLGGGGFMLLRTSTGDSHFIDFREAAPGAATATLYQDRNGHVVPGLSTVGFKAVGVPGSVKGLVYAEQHFGRLKLGQVMASAIRFAREGYVLSAGQSRALSEDKDLARFPDSRRIFQNDGKGWQPGARFRQPQLARTLERIAARPDDFYTGEMARQIADFMRKGGGLITAQDLASYQVKDRVPVRGKYRDVEILSAPPPSSGGTALIESLNILEGFDLAHAGLDSVKSIHLLAEAYRRAFLDRALFMGDPDFSKVPVAQLIDVRYARAWRESIQPEHASDSLTLHRPALYPELDRYAAEHPLLAPGKEPSQTTHYSVVDSEGTAVAVTTTLNDDFGSRVTLGPLGFLLNDEMDDFAAKVGVPNLYGLLQGPANAVGAHKRPLSAMTPTIVLKNGRLWLVLGAEGGPTIITTVANILIGVEDYGLDIQQAVNSPRIHQQWMPARVELEPGRFPPQTTSQLQAMGYQLSPSDITGDAECIQIDIPSGERLGATDPRNEEGRAVGY
jgi:gamma-glutamyltranspeptidase/glutathione hydrolase